MSFVHVSANDSCRIFFNKQEIFNGEVEHETSVASIKSKTFTKSDCIRILYKSEHVAKGWERIFYINAPEERNLKTITIGQQSGRASFTATVLNAIKDKKQPVLIYTISLPADKAMAARIRVRRMFICKIEWN